MTQNGTPEQDDDLADEEAIDLLKVHNVKGPVIKLPNGRKVRIQLFDGEHYRLYEKCQTVGDFATLKPKQLAQLDADGVTLLRAAIPSLTDAEIHSLADYMIHFIGKAAARQADRYLAAYRKNAERPAPVPSAAAGKSKPQLSIPRTKSSTSSSASRKRSGMEPQTRSGP